MGLEGRASLSVTPSVRRQKEVAWGRGHLANGRSIGGRMQCGQLRGYWSELNSTSVFFKIHNGSWAWWFRPVITAIQEAEAGGWLIHGLLGLQSEFKANLSNPVRPCLIIRNN